jgi:probable F420-dependent oxidoreductase
MHPFRFGITASRARSAEAWAALARRAEELGYATLVMPDHLGNQLSPIPALAAAATATRTLRIGSFVFANDYRHPLLLAREAASLDVLSGGRFEFGIGAGWRTDDYRQLGMAYQRPGLRIERLEESLGILKRLFAGERVTHNGTNYQLDGARLAPLPVQRPAPPILVGGGGPRLLRLAARHAQIVGLLPQFDPNGRPMVTQGTEAATEQKVAILREAAGSGFEALELNVLVTDAGIIGAGGRPLASVGAIAKSGALRLVGGSPYVLYGTLHQLREELERRRDRLGISYYVWSARLMEPMARLVVELAGR